MTRWLKPIQNASAWLHLVTLPTLNWRLYHLESDEQRHGAFTNFKGDTGKSTNCDNPLNYLLVHPFTES